MIAGLPFTAWILILLSTAPAIAIALIAYLRYRKER